MHPQRKNGSQPSVSTLPRYHQAVAASKDVDRQSVCVTLLCVCVLSPLTLFAVCKYVFQIVSLENSAGVCVCVCISVLIQLSSNVNICLLLSYEVELLMSVQ